MNGRAWRDHACQKINVALVSDDGKQAAVTSESKGCGDLVEYVVFHDGCEVPRFLSLPLDVFKALRDALDEIDMPTTLTERVEGELKATKGHLEDMRTLVFKGKKK